MSTINLAKNYRLYTPEELRDYAYRGLLEVNNFDMTDVLEYLFQGVIFEKDFEDRLKEEIAEKSDKWYDSGYSDGYEAGLDEV